MKIVPCSAVDTTSMDPLCACTISWAMYNPRPKLLWGPPVAGSMILSRALNGWKNPVEAVPRDGGAPILDGDPDIRVAAHNLYMDRRAVVTMLDSVGRPHILMSCRKPLQ